ncbi:hypothetical protein GCM10017607_11210 [Microbacterium thalassium]|nr:hypothetical protein GCM10017607_11210 [Microbacterium thalassium]
MPIGPHTPIHGRRIGPRHPPWPALAWTHVNAFGERSGAVFILVLLGVLSLAGVVASIAAFRTDGYGRVPTRTGYDTRAPAP